jgi:hypothetical protein
MASIRKRKWGDGREAWVVDYKDQSGKRAIQTFAKRKRRKPEKCRHSTKYGKALTLAPVPAR